MTNNMKFLLFCFASFLLLQDFSDARGPKERQKSARFNAVDEEYEANEDTELPLVQQILQETGVAKLSVVKVLKCTDSDYKRKQIIKGIIKSNTARVLDPEHKVYMDKYGTEFVEFSDAIARRKDSSSGSKTMVEQVITQSNGDKLESVDLIFDCPRWCKTPITFRQTFTPPIITNARQTITARFICENGNQPIVNVIQNSSNKNKQEVRTYVLYKKAVSKSTEEYDDSVKSEKPEESEESEDCDVSYNNNNNLGLKKNINVQGDLTLGGKNFVPDNLDEYGQTDDLEEEEFPQPMGTRLPSITQTLTRIEVNAKMSLVKVIRCTDGSINQKWNNVQPGSSSKPIEITDDTSAYLNWNKFRREPILHSIEHVFNPLLRQTIELCSKSVTQTSVLILDCDAWCKKTISVAQNVQSSSGKIIQSAEIYVVCPKGDKPVITRSINKQRSPNAKIDFKAYVLRRK